MRKIFLLGNFILVGLLMFSLAEAACLASGSGGLEGLLVWGQCILNTQVTYLLVTLAVVLFMWGVIQYYLNPENEEKRKKGKGFIVGGLIALFVIVSMWGLVGVLVSTFNLDDSNVTMPQLPETGN